MQHENQTNDEATTTPAATNENAEVQTLASLLADDPPAPNEDAEPPVPNEDAEPPVPNEDAEPLVMFNDAAERLGLDMDALYALQITTPSGESVTIEQLKDVFGEREQIGADRLAFDEERIQTQQRLASAQQELAEIMESLPANAIKPEVVEKIRERQRLVIAREDQRTLGVIPGWKDDSVREAEMAGMAEQLQQFGFAPDYLNSVVDHKLRWYIRESWQREQRIRKALEKVKAGKPAPTTTSKPSGSAPGKGTETGVSKGTARNPLDAALN